MKVYAMKVYVMIGAILMGVAGTAWGEDAPLLVPQGQADTAAAGVSDLQKAADSAAAKMGLQPSSFRLSLLDKSAEQTFPNIDCQDGSDLLYRWDLKSVDDVGSQHIENAAAFREWYKANCARGASVP